MLCLLWIVFTVGVARTHRITLLNLKSTLILTESDWLEIEFKFKLHGGEKYPFYLPVICMFVRKESLHPKVADINADVSCEFYWIKVWRGQVNLRTWPQFFSMQLRPAGCSAYLRAAERTVRDKWRGWGGWACSSQLHKLLPKRQSPGRAPLQSAAPTARPRNWEGEWEENML